MNGLRGWLKDGHWLWAFMGGLRPKLAFRPPPILRLDVEHEFTLKLMTIRKAYFIRQ